MVIYSTKTQTGKKLIYKAAYNEGSELYHVYGSFSSKKAEAFDDCKKKCEAEAGDNFRIISHNTNFFSVAWEFEYEGSLATHIITPANDYVVKREEVNEC